RHEHDMALGNVIGSNLFNLLMAVGLAGLIQPFSVDAAVLFRDYGMVLLATVVLYVFCVGFRGRPSRVSRNEGGVLLAGYVAYMGWLLASST
ncbi:MAG: calcium/sodium antiporter, partial [Limnobacter sp.]|nr:calcium/sodium antiporter [Limnobacter sp.]